MVALSAGVTAVSTGSALGFTSQIEYSFQHGRDEALEMTIAQTSWIGVVCNFIVIILQKVPLDCSAVLAAKN